MKTGGDTNDLAPASDQTSGILADLQSDTPSAETMGFAAPKNNKIARMAVVVGVAAAGGLLLWGMRVYSTWAAVTIKVPEIDYQTQTDQSGEKLRQAWIMAALNDDGPPPQIGQDEITQNPFELGLDKEDVVKVDRKGDQDAAAAREAAAAERAKRDREKIIEAEFNSFRLSSVMQGPRPVAVINSNAVTVGSQLGKNFIVTAIGPRSVTMQADGRDFELRMRD